jgi:undecaprenyl-diphosphatase
MVNCLALTELVHLLLRWDREFFYLIHGRTENGFFDLIMPVLSDFDLWRWPLLAVVLAVVIFGRRRARMTVLLAVIAVALSDQISSALLKPLFARPRPSHVLEGVRLLAGRGGRYGFPSAHAANVFSAWIVLALRHPSSKYALVAIPVAVAYSRIYVGLHYPLDVIGGALLGLAIGLSVVALGQRLTDRMARQQEVSDSEPSVGKP